jgi:anti-anti-sigma factor
MRPQLQFTCRGSSGRACLGGDLDLSTGDNVVAIFESLEMCGSVRVDVDLSAVTFIDAYTLALLRRAQRRLDEVGGHLHVVAGSEWYVRVCALARYESLLPVPADLPHRVAGPTSRDQRAVAASA